MTDTPILSAGATQEEVAEIVAIFKEGASIDGLMLLDAASKIDVLVEQGAQITKPLILGDDLLFVQPDGTIIGLLDGAKSSFALTADNLTIPAENIVAVALQQGAWTTVADAVEVDLLVLGTTVPNPQRGSGEESPVLAGDPLNGLPISPLLPPTDYQFPELREREIGEGGLGESDIVFSGSSVNGIFLTETDGPLGIRVSDFVQISAGNASDGEQITSVRLELPNLPLGTTANAGSLRPNGSTGTFVFSGTLAEYNALVVTLPADFSTLKRTDFASGSLVGTITATSNFIGDSSYSFPIAVGFEGDLGFVGAGAARQPETDQPVVFVLKDVLTPQATDADGSENVTSVTLDLPALPPGARVSTDGGLTFTTVSGSFSFSGTLADYEALQVELPADFSTTNPATSIQGTLQATTDEGANESAVIELIVDATPDIVITPPVAVSAVEDGDGVDGAGVTVDLDLNIFVQDLDGSEDQTTVDIAFTDLPAGTVFSNGSFASVTGTWTGTMAEANALTLLLPGDYSGTISSVITASNVEGSATSAQTIVVSPAADVDVAVTDIVLAETDAPLVVNPSANWVVSISDADAGLPPETLQSVSLTLNGLPPGVVVQNVPPGSFTYDAAAGGVFAFTGTALDYDLLRLVFPEDFATQSAADPLGSIQGVISGVSTEGAGTPAPVTLRISSEGDIALNVFPPAPLVEAETGQTVQLGAIFNAIVTDNDGSEAVETIDVVMTGLPSIGFGLGDTSGFPAGAVTLVAAADGTQTLTATFDVATLGDAVLAFDAATFTLPSDFSTSNRSDLTLGTSQPISITTSITTDEDSDRSVTDPPTGRSPARPLSRLTRWKTSI